MFGAMHSEMNKYKDRWNVFMFVFKYKWIDTRERKCCKIVTVESRWEVLVLARMHVQPVECLGVFIINFWGIYSNLFIVEQRTTKTKKHKKCTFNFKNVS